LIVARTATNAHSAAPKRLPVDFAELPGASESEAWAGFMPISGD
jgi:hypothetical protein